MGFNARYWGEGSDQTIQRAHEDGEATGFYSGSAKEVQAATEEDAAAAARLLTLFHEHGHTVGRVIYGEQWFPIEGHERNEETRAFDREQIAEPFRRDLAAVLDKYGVLRSSDVESFEQIESSLPYTTTQPLSTSMNGDRLRAHLSDYGKTNLHELMAETWASYMTNPEPTEFVLEVGNLMNDYFQKYLNHYYPEAV